MHFSFNPVASGSAVALLLLAIAPQSATAQRMYTKSSPVLQVDAKNWEKLIVNSHLPSVVEFYAPWCGHCQNLKPAYEKAAGSLSGIVQIAAVNCDEDSNKPLCGQLGIQGFPTLKTVRPASLLASNKAGKKGKPAIADYKGPRSAKDIAEAARGLLPNLVTKVTDADLSSWLAKDNETAKALLFTDKGTTSALLKSLALDFKPSLRVGQARGDREDKATDMFGAEKFPTFVVLPGGDKAAVTYDGEMNKADIFAFLKTYAEPVSAASAGTKNSGTDGSSKSKPKSSSNKKASKAKPSAASETLEDDVSESSPQPTLEDVPKPASVPVDAPPPLRTLSTPEELSSTCLGPKTGTCVLALLPSSSSASDDSGADPDLPPAALDAVSSLTQLSAKLHASNAHVFPFYVVSASAGARLRKGLGLEEEEGESAGEAGSGQVTLLAVNGKRRWVRRHEAADKAGFGLQALQAWVDGVKLGDGRKDKLPDDLVLDEEAIKAEIKDEL